MFGTFLPLNTCVIIFVENKQTKQKEVYQYEIYLSHLLLSSFLSNVALDIRKPFVFFFCWFQSSRY